MAEKKFNPQAAWRLRNPWARFVEWARRRCKDTTCRKWFPYYGAKGVRCFLTAKQLKEVWERDAAHLLRRASLDRRNPNADYANWNVRFIEFDLNSRLAWDPDAELSEAEVRRRQAAPEFA